MKKYNILFISMIIVTVLIFVFFGLALWESLIIEKQNDSQNTLNVQSLWITMVLLILFLFSTIFKKYLKMFSISNWTKNNDKAKYLACKNLTDTKFKSFRTLIIGLILFLFLVVIGTSVYYLVDRFIYFNKIKFVLSNHWLAVLIILFIYIKKIDSCKITIKNYLDTAKKTI